ncbi:hypothetical protein BD410DRAFT_802197 [Rickenella mellea]|uniref:Ricin B lectin domain-containing protein n=1 Tax=Rickenella mellea TaxID=50990 RepID=A0A4Y7QAC2_9AGAM|nr:hypothetical protein BD410DRAFT_802197 [Rickenella mellea]
MMIPQQPHITGELVPTARYRIQNVRWPLSYLELPDPNDGSEVISALDQNKKTQFWNVLDLGHGKHSIMNQGSAKYANSGPRGKDGSPIVGSSNVQELKITECSVKGTYTIGPTDGTLFWGLPDERVGAQLQLDAIPTERNLWLFIRVD